MCADLCSFQVLQHKHFVGAAGVFDHAHAGLVQILHAAEFGFVGAAHQRDFAEGRITRQHGCLPNAGHVARDAAHGYVETVGLQIFE